MLLTMATNPYSSSRSFLMKCRCLENHFRKEKEQIPSTWSRCGGPGGCRPHRSRCCTRDERRWSYILKVFKDLGKCKKGIFLKKFAIRSRIPLKGKCHNFSPFSFFWGGGDLSLTLKADEASLHSSLCWKMRQLGTRSRCRMADTFKSHISELLFQYFDGILVGIDWLDSLTLVLVIICPSIGFLSHNLICKGIKNNFFAHFDHLRKVCRNFALFVALFGVLFTCLKMWRCTKIDKYGVCMEAVFKYNINKSIKEWKQYWP